MPHRARTQYISKIFKAFLIAVFNSQKVAARYQHLEAERYAPMRSNSAFITWDIDSLKFNHHRCAVIYRLVHTVIYDVSVKNYETYSIRRNHFTWVRENADRYFDILIELEKTVFSDQELVRYKIARNKRDK